MDEILADIYRLKIPMPNPDAFLGYNNAYLIKGADGCILVDTGWNTDEAFSALNKGLDDIGIALEDISQIVVTHIHPDHYGLAGRLKSLTNAKLYLHQLERGLITERYIDMEPLLKQTDQWLNLNGVPAKEVAVLQKASVEMGKKFVAPVFPDVLLIGGECISTHPFKFHVLWTPGHSPGQVCLYEPSKKILISGDHILPNITPNIGLHPHSSPNPIGDFISSLKRLKLLDVELVLPGHETPFSGLRTRINKLIQHHKERNANILLSLKSGAKTGYQIAAEIPWLTDIGGADWKNLSPLDKRLAVQETLAHLEMLRNNAIVNKFSQNGYVYYQTGSSPDVEKRPC